MAAITNASIVKFTPSYGSVHPLFLITHLLIKQDSGYSFVNKIYKSIFYVFLISSNINIYVSEGFEGYNEKAHLLV